jgi:hypothetical protein
MINKRPERQEIERLLPWHAARTLSRREADLVERALDLIRQELAETVHLNETLGAPSTRAMEKLACATPPAHQPNACAATVPRIAPASRLARAASGHTAVPPSSVMNLRRSAALTASTSASNFILPNLRIRFVFRGRSDAGGVI